SCRRPLKPLRESLQPPLASSAASVAPASSWPACYRASSYVDRSFSLLVQISHGANLSAREQLLHALDTRVGQRSVAELRIAIGRGLFRYGYRLCLHL